MRRLFIALVPGLLLTFVAAACGGRSPVSPSVGSAGPGGATINGSILGLSSGGAPLSMRPTSATLATSGQGPVTVSVVGTNVSTTVSGTNQFTLQGVPPGPTSLRFSGGGISTTDVDIDDVEGTETIDVTLTVDGDSVTLESQRRSLPGGIEIEGRVESLPPTTAPDDFVVAGQTVTTDTATAFFLNGSSSSFADLQLGVRVHVKGTMSGATFLAAVVNIQNTNGSLPVNVNGIIQGFSGTSDDFQFTIDGRLIKGTAATAFFGNSTFDSLADGKQAEVKGVQGDGYVAAQRIHVNDDLEKVEIEGVVGPISGSGLVLTFTVGTTTVHTSSSTEVKRKGNRQDASSIQTGMMVSVVGVLQLDGSVSAIKIQIESDAPGGVLKIDGTIGGLSGTCPALQFSVKGYDVTTNTATVFTPSCTGLKSGTKVSVTGVVQPNGSVLASDVTK